MRNRGPRGTRRPPAPPTEVSFARGVTTTSATPVLETLLATKNGSSYSIEVRVSCINAAKTKSAGYKLFAHFRNDGGTLTQVNNGGASGTTVVAQHESDAGLAASLTSSGQNIQVSLTGLADILYWRVDGVATVVSVP